MVIRLKTVALKSIITEYNYQFLIFLKLTLNFNELGKNFHHYKDQQFHVGLAFMNWNRKLDVTIQRRDALQCRL